MNRSLIKPRFHALIPCAGSGSRAGTAGPKQYQPIAGKPLVMHTLEAFMQVGRVADILVLVAPDADLPVSFDSSALPAAGLRERENAAVFIRCGGATRAATVRNGLEQLKNRGAADSDWVLVHDAARCLVTAGLIDRLIDACSADDVGGLLALRVADTLKREQDGRVAATLSRDGLWLAQTPQMFRIGMLVEALVRSGDAVTDEAGAIEAMGLRPLLVPGDAENLKVTYPGDFTLAELALRNRRS